MNKVPNSLRAGWIFFCLTTAVTFGYSRQGGPPAGQVNVARNINTSIKGERLTNQVNTAFNELGPMPTKDGKRLYFSRQGHPDNVGGAVDEDIWYSEFDEATQSWMEAINIGPPLNNSGPNFITGIGRIGDTLLLANVYRKNGKMTTGVSVSVRVVDSWSFPVPVNIEADYNLARRATYDVSHDRKVMVISQHKFETRGNLDLYVTFRNQSRKQQYSGTESINLGEVINTPADETCPWLSYDGMTLYFASDGHDGYGRMDLYKSVRLDDTWTNWSKPENLGPGINSGFDELSFNFNPLSRYAYFTRGLSSQNSEIFRIEMTHLFLDQESEPSKDSKSIYKPAEIGETKVVMDVFRNDETAINKEAVDDLLAIIAYLKKHKTMEVLVSAHSQKQESRPASTALSIERAINVVDYMVNNGIERTRLIYSGFGHDIVINQETTHETQSAFKDVASSVEFKIIKY
ncbi:MAG TPA: OmpA family protein [Flavitalea sp.]|nr:OmpA family protein [Flavitalea sp.]